MLDHLADLIEVRGDDPLAHRHVLEQLGRRAEKRRSVLVRHVWRDEDVTGGEVLGTPLLRNQAGEHGGAHRALLIQNPTDRRQRGAVANHEQANRRAQIGIRPTQRRKSAREYLGAVPWPERADEANELQGPSDEPDQGKDPRHQARLVEQEAQQQVVQGRHEAL